MNIYTTNQHPCHWILETWEGDLYLLDLYPGAWSRRRQIGRIKPALRPVAESLIPLIIRHLEIPLCQDCRLEPQMAGSQICESCHANTHNIESMALEEHTDWTDEREPWDGIDD